MKPENVLQILAFVALAQARPTRHIPLAPREVPQEHSHEQFLTSVRTSLNINNPAGIVDPVFGLLGDAAAAAGLGSISDVECLQQATADRAFTNAKAAGDVTSMTNALIYRALERNTGAVGQMSNPCSSIQAVNPEIAAIQQHQDPASSNAAAINKQIALNLAIQIASIGGDPQAAINSSTFAPGTIGDPTAAGNTCDDQNDPVGCIFTQNKLVPDVTADEITAAVASGIAGSSATAATTTNSTAAASTSVTSNATECSSPAASSSAAAQETNSTTPTPTSTTSSAADFGTCTGANPTITFGPGFDGRNTDSFEPVDEQTFNHGSALGIGVITSFICQQLNDKCKSSATVLAACASGSAAAAAASGQAAADAFNAAFA